MHLKDKVILDKSVFIADTATVLGRVILEKDVSVWFSAVVRGDYEEIIIKEGTNIQDCCVIHTDHNLPKYIGKNCVIGHGAIVHGSKLGDNVLIAMGAVVLNGCEIGDNCIIGAGAVVKEFEKIPPNSLVLGVPGTVVKKIDEDTVQKIKDNSKDYIELSKEYLKGYNPIGR